jgi:hypothetical protein
MYPLHTSLDVNPRQQPLVLTEGANPPDGFYLVPALLYRCFSNTRAAIQKRILNPPG